MMKKKAIITGIRWQDGAYLGEFLPETEVGSSVR
jgi:GDP-D-mannose dehydratase